MTKCKTKTFVQVCRGANREEMELLRTAPWLACIGRAKEGKKLKVCETGYMGEGQKTELYSPPLTASLVLQCSALISSSRSQTQKNSDAQRGHKSAFRGVGSGNSFFFKTK